VRKEDIISEKRRERQINEERYYGKILEILTRKRYNM
jgi:hypothetical protein